MKNVIISVCILTIALTAVNVNYVLCQEKAIHSNLMEKMAASPDSELIRVLVFFKGKKVFSPGELSSMSTMTPSASQSYHARALKQFGDVQSANIKHLISEGAKTGRCSLIADLWAAYGISCWATKDIILQIGFLLEVREIVWDWDRPSVGSEIGTAPLLGKKKNVENKESVLLKSATTTIEWGIDKIGAPKVWNLGKRGTGVVVAVLDGGCNYNHPDFSNHMWDGSNQFYDANNNGVEDSGERLFNHGWDKWNGDNNPINDDGHGTLVAGIIAGDGTGGTQTGVAPDVKLMIIKNAHGTQHNETKMMDGLQWLFDMKAQPGSTFQYPDIINMSQRMRFDWQPSYEAWRTLCLNVFNAGMIIIAAAGNEGGGSPGGCSSLMWDKPTNSYVWVCAPCLIDACPTSESPCGYPIPYSMGVPANIPSPWLHPDQPAPLNTAAPDNHVNSVIACGWTDNSDVIVGTSSRGPAAWENIRSTYICQKSIRSEYWDYKYNTVPANQRNALIKPDVSAPGGVNSTSAGGGYECFDGTSSSAPHVAGTVALMLSANPSLRATLDPDLTNRRAKLGKIAQILQETAVELGDSGKDNAYGAGRLDAYKAVKYIIENYSTTLGGIGKTVNFSENFTIKTGTTLTILPGTTVKFAAGVELIVNGKFIAKGTSSQPITFTSLSATPSRGDWSGIFLSGGPDTLEYCNLRYANYGIVAQNSNTHFLKYSTIENCYCYGLWGINTGTNNKRIILHYCTIRNNGGGIALSNSRIELFQTSINTNSCNGIYVGNSHAYLSNSQVFNHNSCSGIFVDGSTGWMTLSPDGHSPGRNTVNNNAGGEIYLNSGGGAYLGERVRYICGYDCGGGGPTSINMPECPPIYCTRDRAGYNNIYNSFTFSGRLVNSPPTSPMVKAQLNYWGSCPPDANGFIGNVDRSIYICTMQKYSPVASNPPEQITPPEETMNLYPPADREIWFIRHLIKQIKDNPDASLYALHLLSTKIQPDEILPDSVNTTWQTYLSMLQMRAPSARMRSLAGAYRIQTKMELQEYNSAINLANAVLARTPGDEMWMYCNVQKVNSYIAIGDTTNARTTYTLMGSRGQKISPAAMEMLASSLDLGILLRSSSISINDTLSPEQANYFELPKDYILKQNYPNPFNPSTRIEYSLPVDAHVTLKVYDILGREVKTLVNEIQYAGYKSVPFNAENLSSGLYIYKLTTGASTGSAFTDVKKMILIR